MVEIDVVYEGDLHCRAKHGPSGSEIFTDAPKDNQGGGEAFSPTDLVGTAMGTCMLTMMGVYARKKGIDLKGSRVHVTKEMISTPHRRIRRLGVTFDLPAHVDEARRAALRRAAETCPVHRSLHPDVEVDLTFRFES
jgi:putative redox protein